MTQHVLDKTVDSPFWDQVEDGVLVTASSVCEGARRTIRTLVDRCKKVDEFAELVLEVHRADNAHSAQSLICGDWRSGPSWRQIEVFWQVVERLVADQCGTFSLRPGNSEEPADPVPLDDAAFWKIQPTPQGDTKILRQYLSFTVGLAFGEFKSSSATRYKPTQTAHGDEDGTDRLVDVYLAELVQLAHRSELGGKAWASADAIADHTQAHFRALEQLLTRGRQAAAIEVAARIRLLGGRYASGQSVCEPWWRTSFDEGIKYVLTQQEDSGEWSMADLRRSATPLIHKFMPLVAILDLGQDVLLPHLDSLVAASSRAVGGALRDLEQWVARISEVTDEPSARSVRYSLHAIRDIAGALALGTMVNTRIRDLVSESLLTLMGATEPAPDYEWEDIPDSLGFRNSVATGVIQKWTSGDNMRPGAVLIFGPPGTGKTSIAKLIAEQLNRGLFPAGSPDPEARWRFLEFTPADFARDGADRIVARAERIFSNLRRVRRCVVLLDEMEEFLIARTPGTDKDSRLVTTAFLPLLQETVRSREIILVVATNFVGRIDPAVTRRGRFDMILPLGPPHHDAREAIVARAADRIAHTMNLPSPELTKVLATYTMGYSYSEIQDFLRELDSWLAGPHPTIDRPSLVVELWRLRQERIPTALSGGPGASWQAFADEARRYSRPQPPEDPDYWKEPPLPLAEERGCVLRRS